MVADSSIDVTIQRTLERRAGYEKEVREVLDVWIIAA